MFHVRTKAAVRRTDFKILPLTFISEIWTPELRKCTSEGCKGGRVTKKGLNEMGPRDVYGIKSDERSFAPQRFECLGCKTTFGLGTDAMSRKLKLWETPSELTFFISSLLPTPILSMCRSLREVSGRTQKIHRRFRLLIYF